MSIFAEISNKLTAMANKNAKNQETKKPSFVSEPPKAAKKETKSLCIPTMLQKLLPVCYSILFAALAAYYLISLNSDTLFFAQEKNLFLYGCEFFNECMSKPGGLLYWAGTYLTQYFYNPTVGSAMLIAVWLITVVAAKYAFNMKWAWTILVMIPLVALLCSDILIGYWIYYLKHPGYWFTSSIGLLITLIATLVGRVIPEKAKLVWIPLWTLGGFYLFGWWSLIGALYMAVNYCFCEEKKMNKFIIPSLAAVMIILSPVIGHLAYNTIRLEDAWIAALPLFWSNTDFTFICEIPFILAAFTPILFVFTRKRGEKEEIKGTESYALILTIAAVFGASIYTTDKVNFDNYNYHAEMRMYRAIEEQRWNDALYEMSNLPGDATREMVLFKNIALFNTGNLGTSLFHYNNMSEQPYVYDSLKVHMVQTGAPLIYYNHAKVNFSYRWCMENSVEDGFKIQDLKLLTLSSIISEEWDVAKKYIDILKLTTFHKDWAMHYDSLVANPKLITEYHEFDNIRELYSHMGTTLDGDNGLCEMYILNYFCHTMNKDSKFLQELTLAYSLIQKDIQLFWPRFFLYAELHHGEEMPIHYQEAAYLYGRLEPDNVNIKGMPFNKELVIDRYENFTMMSQQLMLQMKDDKGDIDVKRIGEAMKSMYGDSFYWFYFFCRDIKSY